MNADYSSYSTIIFLKFGMYVWYFALPKLAALEQRNLGLVKGMILRFHY
jgi:hypothetical protein